MKRLLSSFFIATAICLAACTPENAETRVTGISLSPKELTLIPGESKTIEVTVEPSTATDQSVVWKSADDLVATVGQNGKVTGVMPGSVRVTATSTDGGFTAYCTVTVESIPVKSITVTPDEITLEVEQTFKLSATVEPDNASDKRIVWRSGDKNVVTVDDNGVVSAVGTGTAKVTASASGSSVKGTCSVVVKEKTISVTGVSLSASELFLMPGEKATLTATVSPENATNKSVSWSISDASVAKVYQDGSVTALANGNAVITASTSDGTFKATCSVTVESYAIQFTQAPVSCLTGNTLTYQVKTTVPKGKSPTVKWTSGNTNVLSLVSSDNSSATFKGVNPGTAEITASIGDNFASVSKVCTVSPNITGVKISRKNDENMVENGDKLLLTVGETYKLSATCQGYTQGKVSWKSDYTNYATVGADGTVKAIKATVTTSGESFTYIWAISEDNPDAKDYVKVVIYDKPTSVVCTSANEDPDYNLVKPADERLLKFQVLPKTARQSIKAKEITKGWTLIVEDNQCVVKCPSLPDEYSDRVSFFSNEVPLVVASMGDKQFSICPLTVKMLPCQYYASDVKPLDYIYYKNGTVSRSDGGLRTIIYKLVKKSVKPTSNNVVGIATQIAKKSDESGSAGTVFNSYSSAFSGIGNYWHGAAVALQDASSGTVWSQDHDNVQNSSNWNAKLYIMEDINWYYAKPLSVGAYNYNEKRGSSHDIKAYEAVLNYGRSTFTTIEKDHWVLPTKKAFILDSYRRTDYSWYFYFYTKSLLNENILQAGGTALQNTDYWSINTSSGSNDSCAISTGGTSSILDILKDKNQKLPVRAWFVF